MAKKHKNTEPQNLTPVKPIADEIKAIASKLEPGDYSKIASLSNKKKDTVRKVFKGKRKNDVVVQVGKMYVHHRELMLMSLKDELKGVVNQELEAI